MKWCKFVLGISITLTSLAIPISAERLEYPPEEFLARRNLLAKNIDGDLLLMFSSTLPTPGIRFRQDHDFFYLTGNESLNAVLVMDLPSGDSHLFLPKLSAAEIKYEGNNWLNETGIAQKRGFETIQPLEELHNFLAQSRRVSGTKILWTRLSEPDFVNQSRFDTALKIAQRQANPFAHYPTEDAARIVAIREQFPYYKLRDISPDLDRLRLIKTKREIERLTHNGRISAEAINRAIVATAPGKFEYELEAEATYWLIKNGFQAAAYPAIVGSGPNGNQWHYENNGRQMKENELVVMDYGGALDYLTIDITRTWPVSGIFTETQKKAYRCVLDAQKAMIQAIRPGVTHKEIRAIGERVYESHGFSENKSTAFIGHYVGMSVHDVGDWGLPFKAGMVIALEPLLDLPDDQIHVRIEDTILITKDGSKVLTSAAPKEINEVIELLRAN
jgi:Xaa-Pro aminopeptidase